MSEVIVVTSGKGGVGKTTVAAFLGFGLASRGKRTIVCDMDFGLNNLDIVMGVENKIQFDVSDVLEGRCRASQALVECSIKNLFMISSARFFSDGKKCRDNIKGLFEGLRENFDYVILDCPAGLDTGFHRAVSFADSAIAVVTPALSSMRDTDKALTVLRSYDLNKISLVVNMARGDLMFEKSMISVTDVEDILKTKVIGVIPYDDRILVSESCHQFKEGMTAKALKNLTNAVITGKIKYYNPENEYSGFKGSIKRSLRKII